MSHRQTARYLDSPVGRLYAVQCMPTGDKPLQGQVLLLPPFAEELNSTRHLLNVTMRLLARHGYAALLLDMPGSGDSEGDFADASLAAYHDAAAFGLAQLASESPVHVLGIRAGAMLAMDLLAQAPQPAASLLLWQPLLTGAAVLHEFLRPRIAASLLSGGPRESITSILADSAREGHCEASGYRLPHPFLTDLAAWSLPGSVPAPTTTTVLSQQAVDLAPLAALVGAPRALHCTGKPVWTPYEGPANLDYLKHSLRHLQAATS